MTVASRRIFCGLIVFAVAAMFWSPASAEPDTYFDLYRAGRTGEARTLVHRRLVAAEARGGATEIWGALMQVAWLEESLGEHKLAIEFATRALDIASQVASPWRIGRSLCWIGWSYTSLGLYELALEFYGRAIEIGIDGEEIRFVSVWGLATQETGAIHAKMGELAKGAELISWTTDYARHHGVDVGVAEGASHLARIALEQGDIGTARELADESLAAALRCDCSPYNTARAHVSVARVALAQARSDPKFRGEAIEKVQAAHDYASKISDRRHVAEARLLESYVVDSDDLDRRVELVTSAVELLAGLGSELRGTAEAQLGTLFLVTEQSALAEIYLRNGLEINRELFRKIDSAYILSDLAEIDAARGDAAGSFEKLGDAAAQAEASGALPLAAETQEILSDELFRHGFERLAASWAQRANASLDGLLAVTHGETARAEILERKARLGQRIAEIVLGKSRTAPARTGAP